MKLIAFSGRARSGKTSMAQWLKSTYGYEIYTIAKYLKELCMDLLDMKDPAQFDKFKTDGTDISNIEIDGNKWADIISFRTGIDRDVLVNELAQKASSIKTVRDLLQILGTDIIRVYNPDWHINECLREIKKNKCEKAVIDDCRFPNEKLAIENMGGTVYFLCRPEKLDQISNHASEIALKWRDFPESQVLVNIENEDDSEVPKLLTEYFKEVILDGEIYIINEENYETGVSMDSWYKTPESVRRKIQDYGELLPYLSVKQGKVLLTVSKELVKNLIWNMFGINKPVENKLIKVNDPFIIEDLKEFMNADGKF